MSLSGPSDGWAVAVQSLWHTHSLCTKLAETCPGHGAGELAEPGLGYMGRLLWPASVLGSGQWHRCGLVSPWCLAFLAWQTSTWQHFPTVSVTGDFIDRCHRMPVKPVHDITMFFQHLRCSLVIHWCTACSEAPGLHCHVCHSSPHSALCPWPWLVVLGSWSRQAHDAPVSCKYSEAAIA